MSEPNESTNSALLESESEPSSESWQTYSPLEEMLAKDVTQMDQPTLREHLMRLREIASSPVKRATLLKEESSVIVTRRTPKVKKPSISEDMY